MSHALVRCNYRCNGGFQQHRFDPLLFSPSRNEPPVNEPPPPPFTFSWRKREIDPGWKPRCLVNFLTDDTLTWTIRWNFFSTRFSSLETYRAMHYYYCFTKERIRKEILKYFEISFSFMHGNKCARGPISPLPRVNGYSFTLASFLHRSINSWERYDDEVYKYCTV